MQKQEIRVWSLGQEVPLEEGMGTTPLFLLGKSHGQRSLVGYSPWGHKELDKKRRDNWATSLSLFIIMVTYSNIFIYLTNATKIHIGKNDKAVEKDISKKRYISTTATGRNVVQLFF